MFTRDNIAASFKAAVPIMLGYVAIGLPCGILSASIGMNAIQMLVNTEVDLILLDYEMPVVKGPQVLEMLRSETHTRDIPVMFLTSKNDRESIIQVMSLNPANYLLKSLPQAEIMGKIAEFFEAQDSRL